ncbi:hypothetical protein SAMN02982929_00133 [Saccharopolyspora kobensis]|uniref:Secreted protein n=1 Tax=Saccharopolyspora kobensis TaxID=146035 RepID=A0A1H5T7S3_9PSEU|nr:hypothetical protein [Saccharopolyspora kobensis]SEF58047.1 hypothetical protein SAMN02982929_00133 [Saccharopolyspora kobensis]SFC49922.1 hypothetical protein SAMN05216506_101899 [Saccharopolyspora kobensis]
MRRVIMPGLLAGLVLLGPAAMAAHAVDVVSREECVLLGGEVIEDDENGFPVCSGGEAHGADIS